MHLHLHIASNIRTEYNFSLYAAFVFVLLHIAICGVMNIGMEYRPIAKVYGNLKFKYIYLHMPAST